MGTKDGGKKPNPNDLNSFKGFFYYMIIRVRLFSAVFGTHTSASLIFIFLQSFSSHPSLCCYFFCLLHALFSEDLREMTPCHFV